MTNTKVSRGAEIRNRYNQVPHLTQDTNGKVTNSQLDTTNESREVSPFPAGDHKAHINRHAQRHSKHKTEQKHKRSTKEVPPWNGQPIPIIIIALYLKKDVYFCEVRIPFILVKCITREVLGAYYTYLPFCLVLKVCEALNRRHLV